MSVRDLFQLVSQKHHTDSLTPAVCQDRVAVGVKVFKEAAAVFMLLSGTERDMLCFLNFYCS